MDGPIRQAPHARRYVISGHVTDHRAVLFSWTKNRNLSQTKIWNWNAAADEHELKAKTMIVKIVFKKLELKPPN